MRTIQIIGAKEGNLKNVSLELPKDQLVVFTGLSGSGKSTLLIDVLFQECQRQYLEAMGMQGIRKPKVERIRGVSPAVLISQTEANRNPRSTVGTMTDVYTDLRMVYEKLSLRRCPFCGELVSAADCKEETEKAGSDFSVYMYCCACGKRMDKLTRTHFSFNTREGACPVCEGLGTLHTVQNEKAVDERLPLEEGAVRCWEKQYGHYQTSLFYAACRHYGLDVPKNVPVERFGNLQKTLLYDGAEAALLREALPDSLPPKTASKGKFEGVIPNLWRRFAEKEGDAKQLGEFFETVECPACGGERLAPLGRSAAVQGTRLPELSRLSLEQLCLWVEQLAASLPAAHAVLVDDYLRDIRTKLQRFLRVGLGYLSLDRRTVTLSGGELQRLRLAAVLDSELSGVLYLLDEPTAGLHPRDTEGLVSVLRKLRDLGNSVYVIEHDMDVMRAADLIVDMGPGSGKYGGEIAGRGTLEEIAGREASATGRYLHSPHPPKSVFRKAAGTVRIRNADCHNLRQVDVDLPVGCLTAVTGPSGSGKSTLIFDVLAKEAEGARTGRVSGLEQFSRVAAIGQAPVARMKRSNAATYSGAYAEIRDAFARTEDAKALGLTARDFSFNTPGGRCENCQGLGVVESNMLFFTNTEVICPVCGGKRFHENVLAVSYRGLTIKEVLELSVEEAAEVFADRPKLLRILQLLLDVGLGYLELGQTLTTLSGGEGQRLKLAKELLGGASGAPCLYLMDEPTTGLHPQDVEHFLTLLDRMVDAGNTVVVVEHNGQLIRASDWVIDLGPEGGEKGGRVVFTGTPRELAETGRTLTARYL